MMKSHVLGSSKVLGSFLVVASFVFSAQAQPGGGGRGFGFFGGLTGDTVADVLLLKSEKAEKVIDKFDAARENIIAEMRENFQPGGGGDFQALRENMNKKYVEVLKAVLSEDEVKVIEPLLNGFSLRAYAPVRALRFIDLKDEQHDDLLKENIALFTKLNDIRPSFGGGGGGGFEEFRTKSQEAIQAYSEKIASLLTDEQKSAWEAKTAEVEKQLEEEREQRRQRGGFGGRN